MKKVLSSIIFVAVILSMAVPVTFGFDSNRWPAGGETVVLCENSENERPGIFEKVGTWGLSGTFSYLDGSGTFVTSSQKYIYSNTAGSYVKFYLGTFESGNYHPWFLVPSGNVADSFNYEIGNSDSVYASGTVYQTRTKEWLLFTNTLDTIAFSGDGTEYIKLSVNETSMLRVGAVKLTEPTVNEYVVNVGDSAFASSGWTIADAIYSCTGLTPIKGQKVNIAGKSAKYDFKGMIPAGDYDVYFYNADDGNPNNPNSKFHVYNGSGTTQILDFSNWIDLAWIKINDAPITFNDVDNEAYVEIKTASGGMTRIGAIKLVKVEAEEEPTEMLSAPGYSNGVFSVTTNGTGIAQTINAVMIVAEYNNNTLTDLSSKPITIEKDMGNKTETIPLAAKGAGYTYKLMIFDSLETIQPLMDYYSYPEL